MSGLANCAAIVGLGYTEFSRDSGRSELRLAGEAIFAALADAGLPATAVDGLVTFTLDNNGEAEVFRTIGGKELRFFSRIHYGGGGACGPIMQAAMAIATGVAETVVVYRAMNERSEYRFGSGALKQQSVVSAEAATMGLHTAPGLRTAAAWFAIPMRRYMHDFGVSAEDFARIAVSQRDFAATNPLAFFHGKPITADDYFQSRLVADPFRLLDCCQQSDGAVALVLTSAKRARDLRADPVLVSGAAQGACDDQQVMTSYYRADIASFAESALVGRQLYAMSGLSPRDIQCAVFYDHFGPAILPQLEAFGFCKRGESKDMVRAGAISRGGTLPVNPNGGQVGEAYIHGLNGVAEAVRQIRGTASNQVAKVRNVLVTAGTAVPTSAVILSAV